MHYNTVENDLFYVQEEAELNVILSYLPAQLKSEDVEKIIQDAILVFEAKTVKDIGKVMNLIRPKLTGKADMARVGAKIKELLQGSK